jgi:hypothetical protein
VLPLCLAPASGALPRWSVNAQRTNLTTSEPPFMLAVDRWSVMTVGNARSAPSRI